MTHYLTKDNCFIEKKHYSVLIRFVNNWEDQFWNDEKTEQNLLTNQAKYFIGIFLFQAYNQIAANTLEQLYRQELIHINPMLGWNAELATCELREQAELSLLEKLEQNPQILFDVSPLLSSQFTLCEKQFSEMLSEMLTRIQADRKDISRAFFGGTDFVRILKIDGGKSDKHQNGRCACIITTEHGTFLYKPRNLRADTVLYDMVSELFSDIVILPKALDFGQYGYAEYIKDEPAKTSEEAERFFYRLGGVCALFQTFASTDFHCENILAKGEFPAVVDLETFLGVPNAADTKNSDLFQNDLSHSLFFSGIIPKIKDDRELSPLLCKDRYSILPLIDGERVDVRGYLSFFDEGFRAIYHRCIAKKSVLLQYLERLSECRFRCLLRNTNDYAIMLRGLYSVKTLSSEPYRSERIKSLRNALGQTANEQQREKQSAVADEEISSLLCGDVPIFHCIADSKDLYSGEKCVVRDYFSRSIKENVLYNIEHLTDRECEFELDIIHQSLRCAHIPQNAPTCKTVRKEAVLSFSEEAGKVFDEIWEQRIISPSGKAGWLDHRNDGNSFGYLSVNYGMGEGGIAAFASEYYAATGDKRAEKVITDFLDKVSDSLSQLRSMGDINPVANALGTTNIGGTIKASLMSARALGSKKHLQSAVETVQILSGIAPDKFTLVDFYSGLAGWLYLLCTNEELQVIPNYKELVLSLCDRILELQTLNTPQGILTWDTLNKKRPISGLGHGVAGVGLALSSAYRLFPSEKLRIAIQNAFELERLLYSDRLKTWPDFRDSSVPAGAMNGYCSGAPGMASAYLKLHAWGITDFDDDMEKAISKVISTEIMPRDHYCCGNCPSIEFLLDAGKMLERPELTQDAMRRLNAVTERKATNGEYTFLPDLYENYSPPGLLNGLSGIGHLLLKADDLSLNCLLL